MGARFLPSGPRRRQGRAGNVVIRHGEPPPAAPGGRRVVAPWASTALKNFQRLPVADIIGRMRRFAVLVLLLLALPLQYSWAAVGAYCQHGDSAGVQWHFGHHTHEHLHEGEEEPAKKPGAFSSHPDCAHHGSASLPQRSPIALWLPPTPQLVDRQPDMGLADISSEPERPNWASAG